jgi:hypothetical protein
MAPLLSTDRLIQWRGSRLRLGLPILSVGAPTPIASLEDEETDPTSAENVAGCAVFLWRHGVDAMGPQFRRGAQGLVRVQLV